MSGTAPEIDLRFATTPKFNLNLPDIGGDWNAWGELTNANWSWLDDALLPVWGGTMTGLLVLAGDPITNLGAATKQYVDKAAYLPLAGGALSGPLQLPNGTLAAPALAIGPADGTGLSRSGNVLVFGVQNKLVLAMFANSAQFYGSLGMLNNPINQLADAVNPGDALNLRTADARYLQLSGAPLTGPLIAPAMIVQPGGGFGINLYPSDDEGDLNYLQDGCGAWLTQDPDAGTVTLNLFASGVADAAAGYAACSFSFLQNGSFAASNGLYATGDQTLGLYDDGYGNRNLQFQPDTFWSYSASFGLSWNTPTGTVLSIGDDGSIGTDSSIACGPLYADLISVTGNLTGSGTVYAAQGFYASSDSGLSLRDGGANRFLTFAAGWYWNWITGGTYGGTVQWIGNSQPLFSIDPSGTGAFAGSLGASGSVSAGATVYAEAGLIVGGDANFGFSYSSTYRAIGFTTGWNWFWDATTGTVQWNTPNGAQWVLSQYAEYPNAAYNPLSWVGGNGAYTNISDVRMKQDIEPATVGLDEILRLDPINFTRISMTVPEGPTPLPTPRVEIGFSAQQVREVIPEAVQIIMIKRPDGGGESDDDPTLGVQADPILAALVNAVKTLDERLQNVELLVVP